MPVYKVTIVWNRSIMGASETNYLNPPSPTAASAQISNLITARSAMMLSTDEFVGVRISNLGSAPPYGGVRSSQFLTPSSTFWNEGGSALPVPATGLLLPGGVGAFASEMRASMQYSVGYGTNKFAQRYLSGVPRNIQGGEPLSLILSNGGSFVKAWNSYSGQLISTCWVLANNPQAPTLPIIDIIYGPSSLLYAGVVCPVGAGPAPSFVPGSHVSIHGIRGPKGTHGIATLNGSYMVYDVDALSQPGKVIIYLKGTVGAAIAGLRTTPKSLIRLNSLSPQKITSVTPVRMGIHKRGRPSVAPRGRRLSRLSLDP